MSAVDLLCYVIVTSPLWVTAWYVLAKLTNHPSIVIPKVIFVAVFTMLGLYVLGGFFNGPGEPPA